jgi:hypothetical protein
MAPMMTPCSSFVGAVVQAKSERARKVVTRNLEYLIMAVLPVSGFH